MIHRAPSRVHLVQASVPSALGQHRNFWIRHRLQAERLDVGTGGMVNAEDCDD